MPFRSPQPAAPAPAPPGPSAPAGPAAANTAGDQASASSHPAPPPPTHLGPVQEDAARRERFAAHELAIVLSHYDVGVIDSMREYPRGSRRAPKVRIRSETGEYLLKRRAPGRDDPARVAFAHRLQVHLAANGFPVPRLVGTRDANNSMLQHDGRVYEMFEYIRGTFFGGSNRASQYAGYTLARLHDLLAAGDHGPPPPDGSYHAAAVIPGHIAAVPRAVATVDPAADERALLRTCTFLRESYDEAARRVEDLGFASWPRVIGHGDWHPGNLLYRDVKVIAVIDFDSARDEPRATDLANGALQFSMQIGDPRDPASWPEGLSPERLRAVVRGYDQGAARRLTEEEYQALPWLIIEALVAESVVPIAATGRFARIAGATFLDMIERKIRWIRPRAAKVVDLVKE